MAWLIRMGAAFCALLVVILLGIAQSQADERIVSFDSLVEIAADGTLTVTETIEVIAEGDAIQRGIYRDFPTVYKGPLGLNEDVDFEVISVSRDGRSESWFTEDLDNGVGLPQRCGPPSMLESGGYGRPAGLTGA